MGSGSTGREERPEAASRRRRGDHEKKNELRELPSFSLFKAEAALRRNAVQAMKASHNHNLLASQLVSIYGSQGGVHSSSSSPFARTVTRNGREALICQARRNSQATSASGRASKYEWREARRAMAAHKTSKGE